MKFPLNRATSAYLISKLLHVTFIEGGQGALLDTSLLSKQCKKNCFEKLKKHIRLGYPFGWGDPEPSTIQHPFWKFGALFISSSITKILYSFLLVCTAFLPLTHNHVRVWKHFPLTVAMFINFVLWTRNWYYLKPSGGYKTRLFWHTETDATSLRWRADNISNWKKKHQNRRSNWFKRSTHG